MFELSVCSSTAANHAQKWQWTYTESHFPERCRYRSTYLNGTDVKHSKDDRLAKQLEQKERENTETLEDLFCKESGTCMQLVALKRMYQDAVLKRFVICQVLICIIYKRNINYLKISICPTNAHNSYKIVKQLNSFKIIIVAPTCFGLHKPSSGSYSLRFARVIVVTLLSDSYRYLMLVRLPAGSSNGLTSTWRCMCSFELLMMDGKTVWNM